MRGRAACLGRTLTRSGSDILEVVRFRASRAVRVYAPASFLPCWIVLLHLVEIAAWAVVHAWSVRCPTRGQPSSQRVTYTTTGYSDFVVPEAWRLDGVEALTGILVCGWSTGFFFAIVNRHHESNTP